MQWEPSDSWFLGAVVRSPEFVLQTTSDGAIVQAYGKAIANEAPQAIFQLGRAEAAMPAFTMWAPPRVIVAAAKSFAVRTWLSAEVDYQPPVRNQGIDLAPTINGRVGARLQASERIGLGAGLFTDRTTKRNVEPFLEGERVEHRTPVSLTGKAAPDALVLSTTIALRYALGLGQARAVNIDSSLANPPPGAYAFFFVHCGLVIRSGRHENTRMDAGPVLRMRICRRG